MQEMLGSNPPSCAIGSGAVAVSATTATRYLARQPILDVKGRVVAYELLFRNGTASAFSGSGEAASRTMIDNTMIYGLGKLTVGLPAFINCTAETLLSEHIQMLPAPLTVLEVLEDVEPSEEVLVLQCYKRRTPQNGHWRS
jgi:c-di-GMP-related signal transduction protein